VLDVANLEWKLVWSKTAEVDSEALEMLVLCGLKPPHRVNLQPWFDFAQIFAEQSG
jgi:hypothetical protein